ncbi:VOC family protein [Micromonospora sp. WMMD882]|uniref:VOC family protein n=1 Tax=Micromonospora sp. WMMD882 TaxID=3015151 RepID=UPI00248B8923|nr:VOC family protein [Micromonospora sp. WMMD882]WBB78330.1 VOC family protein [Micromonospora sp. WMMD882]
MTSVVPRHSPVVLGLPIADRPTSFRFYREALGLTAVGEPADDGIPEPLQFDVNEGLRLMLVPTGGFGWVVSPHEVAPRGQSECLLGLSLTSPEEVDRLVERARTAGAAVVTEPARQPWGFSAALADPDGHLWLLTVEPTD